MHSQQPEMLVHVRQQPIPPRALGISLAALVVPVIVVFWLPDWTNNGLGMLIWLTALIPAFLLSYYRGLKGVAVALAGGMAVITATQISVVTFDIADPNWSLLVGIVSAYLAISIGIATLSEVLRRERHVAEEMALVDRLTGLPNRRHLELTLSVEFAAAERGRERGRELTVVLFDLDRFKLVNDKHGHPAGDSTLRAFAKVLRANTRKQDLSARFGGEEFVSVLRDTGADAAVLFAQRMLDQLRDSPLPWGAQTVSAGVAAYQLGMGSYELLLSAADRALYQAKEGGRDMVCVAPNYDAHTSEASWRAAAVAPAVPALRASDPSPPTRSAAISVYIIDDDSAVRSVLKRLLARNGYALWDTGDPLEAIRRFGAAAPSERPDVILTDVIMPAMSGLRMIDEIAKISTDIRVIYMSGYVQSEISWVGTPGAVVSFLEKPITEETLLTAMREVSRDIGTRSDLPLRVS